MELQSGRSSDRAPIRIFSQKQIYELATSPQSFLRILDDMPPIRRIEWTEDYEALQLQFKDERNNLAKELAESKKADRIRGQLEEVRGRLSHLERLRASAEFQELEAVETSIRHSAQTEERAQGVEDTIVEAARSCASLRTRTQRWTSMQRGRRRSSPRPMSLTGPRPACRPHAQSGRRTALARSGGNEHQSSTPG